MLAVETALGRDCFYVASAKLSQKSAPGNNVDVTFSLSGSVGDPLQYDELVIEHAGGTTRIALHNRAIMLFTTDEQIYRQVHRVCCLIEDVVDAAQHP